MARDDLIVRPATVARFGDVEQTVNQPCWCAYWRLTSGEYARSSPEANRALLLAACASGTAPGVLAYIGETPVGWCGIGPRASMGRLLRSRTIPAIDDRPVWSIVCFDVRVGYRRRGVAVALLDGAIEYARRAGAVALEAYPTDPDGQRLDAVFSYTGFTGMFEAAGFSRVLETASRASGRPRWLMRLELRPRKQRA